MLLMQKRDANSNFCKYIRRTYESWVTSEDRPLMSPKLFKNNVFPLLDKGEKVCFFLIDNFRLDQWKAIQPMLAEHFNVSEDLYTTILPTSTQYARNAIFSGLWEPLFGPYGGSLAFALVFVLFNYFVVALPLYRHNIYIKL